jgi:hypothetical protein
VVEVGDDREQHHRSVAGEEGLLHEEVLDLRAHRLLHVEREAPVFDAVTIEVSVHLGFGGMQDVTGVGDVVMLAFPKSAVNVAAEELHYDYPPVGVSALVPARDLVHASAVESGVLLLPDQQESGREVGGLPVVAA